MVYYCSVNSELILLSLSDAFVSACCAIVMEGDAHLLIIKILTDALAPHCIYFITLCLVTLTSMFYVLSYMSHLPHYGDVKRVI